MTTPKDFFQTTADANRYKQFRAEVPSKCIEKTISFLSEKFDPLKCTAVDVGCGSGQSSFPLAPHLKKVIAVDTSEAQLAEGRADPRAKDKVEFKKGTAEALPLDDHSVHLVMAMHAAHWFDFDAFKKEVDRVLVPGGILAICSSDRGSAFVGYEEKQEAIYEQLTDVTKPYWNERAINWAEYYRALELPYKCFIRDHSIELDYPLSIATYVNQLTTMSGIAKYIESKPIEGQKLINEVQEKLMNMVNSTKSPEETVLLFRKNYMLLLSRKPSS